MNGKIVALIIIAIFLTFSGYSAYVGASPGSIEMGEFQKGESIEHEIFVTTNFERVFSVDPSYSQMRDNDLFDDENRYEVSEKDISEWVELEEADVNGSSEITGTLPDGSKTTASGSFTMNIDIPPNAEPGYHYGYININPKLTSDGEGFPGSMNWGETKIPFSFRVEGNADRQLSVLDVRAFRLDEDSASVELLLRNSGTVTTSTDGFSFDVYDQKRNRVKSLYANGEKLAPGEEAWVNAQWNSEDRVDQGTYQVDGKVDYITGSTTASGSFSLPDYNVVEVRPNDSPSNNENNGADVPLWFVLIILVILGVLMWGFDIEPFWIVAFVGVLGISAFILLSGVPNYLLAILLIMVAIVIYGGM